MAYAIYETEPIGVDGGLEAVAVHHFCTRVCRDSYAGPLKAHQTVALGEDNETIEGEVCEFCGKPFNA